MTTTDKAAPKLRRCPGCNAKPPTVRTWRFAGDEFVQVSTFARVVCGSPYDDRGCGMQGPARIEQADAIARWNALPRRKCAGRKKAEAAVDALIDAQIELDAVSGYVGLVAAAAVRDAARAHVLSLLGHGADADAGAGGAG